MPKSRDREMKVSFSQYSRHTQATRETRQTIILCRLMCRCASEFIIDDVVEIKTDPSVLISMLYSESCWRLREWRLMNFDWQHLFERMTCTKNDDNVGNNLSFDSWGSDNGARWDQTFRSSALLLTTQHWYQVERKKMKNRETRK